MPDDDRPLAALVIDAAAGDGGAWSGLVDRCGDMVWAVARSHRLNDADAADVSQTTWLKLLTNIDRISDPERVAGWLATTARREALRVVNRRQRDEVELPDVVELRDDGPSLDEALLVGERDAELRRVFALLPERSRSILALLTGDEPLTYRELSAAMDMPIGSIGPTRQRSVEQLRKLVVTEGSPLLDLASP